MDLLKNEGLKDPFYYGLRENITELCDDIIDMMIKNKSAQKSNKRVFFCEMLKFRSENPIFEETLDDFKKNIKRVIDYCRDNDINIFHGTIEDNEKVYDISTYNLPNKYNIFYFMIHIRFEEKFEEKFYLCK